MKIDRQIVIYIVVIVFLVLGIVVLWPKKSMPKLLLDGANQLVGGKKYTVVDNTDESIVISKNVSRIVDGIEEFDNNITGKVISWDGENDLLTIVVKDKQSEFKIDQYETQILLTKSKNDGKDLSLVPITKSINQKAWETAFCIDDPISILVQPINNTVRVVIDTGLRMCGYQGGKL